MLVVQMLVFATLLVDCLFDFVVVADELFYGEVVGDLRVKRNVL